MVGTQKSGAIAADETWGGEGFPSPIQIVGSVTVNNGVDLRILPGCVVVAEGPYALTIVGAIHAGGERRARVVFKSDSRARGSWTGIVWSQAAAVDSSLEYADVLDAAIGLNPTTVVAGKLRVTHSRIANCTKGVSGKNEQLVLDDVTIEDNGTGVDSGTTWGTGMLLSSRIRDNDVGIAHAGAFTLTLSNQSLRVYGNRVGATVGVGATMNAEGVWWGDDSGPDGGGVSGNGDPITGAGTVDVSPWTELGLYCTADELRRYCLKMLHEGSTGGLDDPEGGITDADLEAAIRRGMSTVDGFFTDARLEKALFARGTETNEEVDVVRWAGSNYHRLKYRPIAAISSVERRLGTTWETLPEDEWNGWYTSGDMKSNGYVRIYVRPSSPVAAFRVTYTHGYDTLPADVRDATVKAAALEVLSAILPVGANDTYDPRARRIADELAGIAKTFRGNKVGWST